MNVNMFKSNSIFVILVVLKWQFLTVEADEEAEAAIAVITLPDGKAWFEELAHPLRAVHKCYDLVLDYTGMEKFILRHDSVHANIAGRRVGIIAKYRSILRCEAKVSDGWMEYLFSAGKDGTHVAIKKEDTGYETKYFAEKVLRNDFQKWRYMYNWNQGEINPQAICQKIIAQHQPSLKANWIISKRAVRNGVDGHGSLKRFMTLLCYYDRTKYYEYCEGGKYNEVFPVIYSNGIYWPNSSEPISVEYQL